MSARCQIYVAVTLDQCVGTHLEMVPWFWQRHRILLGPLWWLYLFRSQRDEGGNVLSHGCGSPVPLLSPLYPVATVLVSLNRMPSVSLAQDQ